MPHPEFREEQDESLRPFLTNDLNDTIHDKPDPLNESDVEVGSYGRNIHNSSWWRRIRFMTLRARKKLADEVSGKDRATLDLSGTRNPESPKSKSIFDYCIFGGISAFSIL